MRQRLQRLASCWKDNRKGLNFGIREGEDLNLETPVGIIIKTLPAHAAAGDGSRDQANKKMSS